MLLSLNFDLNNENLFMPAINYHYYFFLTITTIDYNEVKLLTSFKMLALDLWLYIKVL